jgi:DNA-binding response OmpR family regulator
MTILHKLNLILLSNNDHETSQICYLLAKNDWDVNLAYGPKECHEFTKVTNADAIIIYLDNEEIINYDLIDWLREEYPIIVIDELDSELIERKLHKMGCIIIDSQQADQVLRKTINDSIHDFRYQRAG